MRDRLIHLLVRAGLAGLAGVPLVCGSASAAPTWLAPTSLSATGESATDAQVGVDAQGESVAVWQRADAVTANTNDVQAAVRPAGGSWQASPTTLASCFFFSTTPQVAIDPRGDAVAAWECASSSTGDRVIEAATATGPPLQWSKPVQLSDSADINVEDPQVAVDANGDATVSWVTLGSGATSFVQAAQRPAGGTWTQPVTVSRTDATVGAPQVAEDPNGDATTVWTLNNGTTTVAEASVHPAGAAAWSMPIDLSSADAPASNAQVAISPQGTSIAVWRHGTSTSATIQAAVHAAGGQWQMPEDISSAGAEDPQVTVDPHGNAAAIWDRSEGANTIVQAAQLPAGAASWQAAGSVSDAGQSATAAQIAADTQGDLTAVWQRSNGTNTIVQAAVHPAGAPGWQAPADLSATGQSAENAAVAVDPRGNATAVWDRSNGANTIAQAAGYDAGPLLTTGTIPATGTAGQPVAFSSSALGVWSPVTGTRWSFGDGQSASGPAVTHSYGAAGTYKVTVTSTDGLGNPTTSTGAITIAPHMSTPPPPSAPKLSQVSQSHKKWREGPKAATIARRHKPKPPPVGTAISFTVNATARVTLTFTQTTAGRRVKGKCRAPTKHNRKRPHCQRTVTRTTLSYSVTAGRHTVKFDGRTRNGKLPLGAYALHLTAANPVSDKRSRTASLRFTIVK
jgi:hypothetical protein